MSKTIELELNTESIKKAIKELTEYSNSLEEKAQRLAVELAEIGKPVVESHYSMGSAEGNRDFVVTVEPRKRGCVLSAKGNDVCFLEFGTGVMATDNFVGPDATGLPPIYPGSWSETHARQFVTKGFWYYNRTKYYGTSPKMGMFYAKQEMKRNIERKAKEVFSK